MTLVSGWGRFPVVDSELLRPRSFEAVGEAVVTGSVARGNGRANNVTRSSRQQEPASSSTRPASS